MKKKHKIVKKKSMLNPFKTGNIIALKTGAVDLGFYAVMSIIFYLFVLQMAPVANTRMQAETLLGSSTFDEFAMEQQLVQLEDALLKFEVSLALFVIISLILIALFKGIIWNVITGKKNSKEYFLKLIPLNLLVMIWFVVISFVFQLIIVPTIYPFILTFILFPVTIHLANIMYAKFSESNKMGETLKNIFKIGFGKIHKFILPYLLVYVLLFVLMWILGWLGNLVSLVGGALGVIYGIIVVAALLLFIAYSRLYIYNVIKDVEK